MAARHLQLVLIGLLLGLAQRVVGQVGLTNVVGFEPLSHTVIEDVGTFPVCVILQDPAGTNDVLQVQIMAQGSSRPATAVDPADYSTSLDTNDLLTFTVGSAIRSQQCIFVTIVDDTITEPTESFFLSIVPFSGPVMINSSASEATVNIIDNDIAIVIGLSGTTFTVEEGASQEVCVRIISGSTAGRVFSISYVAVPLVAQTPADFGPESGVFIFSDSSLTEQCFTIDAVADGVNEQDLECLRVDISAPPPQPSGLTLSPNTATVCIEDAETVTLQQPSYTVDEEAGSLTVCAQADAVDIGETISVSYSTSNGVAIGGQDFTPVVGTFSFTFNNLVQCVSIPITDDTTTEPEECFNFNIFNPTPSSVQIDQSTAQVCIQDDDQAIVIGLNGLNFAVEEGNSQQVCVGVLSGSTAGRTFSISIFTEEGAAQSPEDFGSESDTFTFSDSSPVQQCVFIDTVADSVMENRECFTVRITLSAPLPQPSSLTLSPTTATVCIDDPETVSIQDPSYIVNEDAGTVTVCAVAAGVDAGETLTVQYSTSNGVAVAGQDYTAVSGTFFFDSNNLLQCAIITIIDDGVNEGEECFSFNIFSPVPSTVQITRSTAPVCIQEDDIERIIGFVLPEYTVVENVGMNNFEVCIEIISGTVQPGEQITVSVTLIQLTGDAIAGEDYEPLSPSSFPLQFNQANMDQQLCAIVQIIDDLVFEPTESFFATLQPLGIAPLVGVTLLPSLTTIFILDDDEPRIGPAGPMIGDDPHFAIYLPSGNLLCYTVQGEHDFTFNLISNENVQMNARFVPDSRREEVTWIGSLGIVVKNTHYQGLNATKIRFDSKVNLIHINDKVTLEAKNIDVITFRDGKLLISEGPIIERFHYPSVRVNLEDLGMKFTVNFTGEHMDMMWNSIVGNTHSHGLIGQFFRKGVEIDTARKLLLLPNKDPVPVMRKPVWAYMEHNVPSDQLCWVAMNPGYQGHHLIDGHYLDYVVDDVLSTNFEFKCKHK